MSTQAAPGVAPAAPATPQAPSSSSGGPPATGGSPTSPVGGSPTSQGAPPVATPPVSSPDQLVSMLQGKFKPIPELAYPEGEAVTPEQLKQFHNQQQRRTQLQQWREGLFSTVRGGLEYGDGQRLMFTPEHVTAIEQFIAQRDGKMFTPQDYVKLALFDQILAQHRDHVTSGLESKLSGTRAGGATTSPTQPNQSSAAGERTVLPSPSSPDTHPATEGRVPSVESFLKQNDPDWWAKVQAGQKGIMDPRD